MSLISWITSAFSFGSWSLGARNGVQVNTPATALVDGTPAIGSDAALQIGAVWACCERISKTIATLPLFVYRYQNGQRELARDTYLYALLHDSPNGRMTPAEFWSAMLLNLMLRGNAYARIDRNSDGTAYALWPMPADQVQMDILEDGTCVYGYRINNDIAVLAAENVLHIKDLGNGNIGLARLDYMRATLGEARAAQESATKMFGAAGKPTGILMVDNVLNPTQRQAIQANFAGMASGSTARLYVLEANMKYQQLSLSPEDQQLLETRQFTVEEIGRWFGVPAVLINHANVTTWGSGIEQIMEGFFKLTIRPLLVQIEQAIDKRVLTAAQRAVLSVEFNFDALLRSSLKDRAQIYASLVQNGIQTRNECRQLENLPPISGGDELTAQTNLAPVGMLGTIQGKQNANSQIPTA